MWGQKETSERGGGGTGGGGAVYKEDTNEKRHMGIIGENKMQPENMVQMNISLSISNYNSQCLTLCPKFLFPPYFYFTITF